METPFWGSGTFWGAVGTVVSTIGLLSSFTYWLSKRLSTNRLEKANEPNKEPELPFDHRKPTTGDTPAQMAVSNWWFDHTYDGRVTERSDEFDFDLHYRSEEFTHNTDSFIAQIVEVDNITSFDITRTRRQAMRLGRIATEQGYDGGKLFVIFDNKYTAEHGRTYLDDEPGGKVQFRIGYLEDRRFIPIERTG